MAESRPRAAEHKAPGSLAVSPPARELGDPSCPVGAEARQRLMDMLGSHTIVAYAFM